MSTAYFWLALWFGIIVFGLIVLALQDNVARRQARRAMRKQRREAYLRQFPRD